jgi:hypothetical protein
MTPERLREFAAAYDRHNVDAIMSFFTDDCVFESPPGGRRVHLRGCDLFDFRGDQIAKKDSYWKIVE